ncbi:O-antigen polymerase [Vibrio cholerae]
MIEQILISLSLIMSLGYIFYKSMVIYRLPFSDPFDPAFVYLIFIIVFFWNNALIFDFAYSFWSSIVVFVGTIAFILGSSLSHNSRLRANNEYKHYMLNYRLALLFCLFVIALSFLLLLIKLSYYGYSLSQYTSNMLEFHATNIKSGGYFWTVFEKFLHFSIIYFIYCMVHRKPNLKTLFLSWLILVLFKLANLSHSRWDYIDTAITILCLWMILIKGRPVFKMYWLLCLPFVPAFMIALNILRHGRTLQGEYDFFQAIQDSLKGDSGPGIYFDKFIQYFVETDAYNHGIFAFYQMFALVPRFIWTDKPVTSSLIHYTKVIMGEDPYLDGSTYTYTVFDFFGIYHFISLVPLMFLFGWLSRKLYNMIYNSQRVSVKVFCIIFTSNYINTLRGSFLDQLTLLIVDVFILMIMYFLLERYKRKC